MRREQKNNEWKPPVIIPARTFVQYHKIQKFKKIQVCLSALSACLPAVIREELYSHNICIKFELLGHCSVFLTPFVFSSQSFQHFLVKSCEKLVISLQFKGKMDDNRATRAVTEYQSLHQRFIINSKNYSLQYSHLYIVRLAQMRKSLR